MRRKIASVRFIFGCIPVPIIFMKRMTGKHKGKCWGFFVVIKPDCISEGLIRHELVHCKQFYRTFGWHFYRYMSSDKYVLQSEAEAYAEHVKTKELSYEGAARKIMQFYKLKITMVDAVNEIRKYIAN